MAIIELKIIQDIHQLACEKGEEEKLTALATKFKEKIESLHSAFPTATEKTLYLMAGMMIIDEIEESPVIQQQITVANSNEDSAKILDEITQKIENLIKKLENTCDVS